MSLRDVLYDAVVVVLFSIQAAVDYPTGQSWFGLLWVPWWVPALVAAVALGALLERELP